MRQKKKILEGKQKELLKKTTDYAELETEILFLVRELKYYDDIITVLSKQKQQTEVLGNLVEVYELEKTQIQNEILTIDGEIAGLTKANESLRLKIQSKEDEHQKTIIAKKTKQTEKEKELTMTKESTTTQISDYNALLLKKSLLDEEIQQYRILLAKGEKSRMPGRLV